MQEFSSHTHLMNSIQKVKCDAGRFTTTFFSGQRQIQSWIKRNALSYLEGARGLLIFRRDRDLYHLYHVAADVEALSTVLSSLDSAHNAYPIMVADLVGRPDDVSVLTNVYQNHGFEHYTALFRMVRLPGSKPPIHAEDRGTAYAEVFDVPEICSLFERVLDRFVDQIPEPTEIETAAARHNILVNKREGAIAGALMFETTGLTSTLRYWYVDDQFRNRGIGASLIRSFLRFCDPTARVVLWVLDENAAAIEKYQHYGFEKEGLVDHILIRGRNI